MLTFVGIFAFADRGDDLGQSVSSQGMAVMALVLMEGGRAGIY